MTARAEKIVRQVEYYFSDVAFPFDAFMTAQSKEEGKGGFVDLSVIATFKKMVAIFADEQASSAASNDSVEGEKISSAMPTADMVAAMAIKDDTTHPLPHTHTPTLGHGDRHGDQG